MCSLESSKAPPPPEALKAVHSFQRVSGGVYQWIDSLDWTHDHHPKISSAGSHTEH